MADQYGKDQMERDLAVVDKVAAHFEEAARYYRLTEEEPWYGEGADQQAAIMRLLAFVARQVTAPDVSAVDTDG